MKTQTVALAAIAFDAGTQIRAAINEHVVAVAVDIYNKGVGPRAKDRLPSWWKQAEE